jgi:hypothetical protein
VQSPRIDELELLEIEDEAFGLRQLGASERPLEAGTAGDIELATDSDHTRLVDVCGVDLEDR